VAGGEWVGFRQSTKGMIQMCLFFYFMVYIIASGGEGRFISMIILPAIKIIKWCPTTASKNIKGGFKTIQ
jgi:hypothetical protein